jgi:hypothetical protein
MNVTWLHVSDFHFRGGDPYDRDVVLRALVQSVKRFRDAGRAPDVIFSTGDVAYSGKDQEYALATQFFDDLLEAVRLDRRHLYLVPGNHDWIVPAASVSCGHSNRVSKLMLTSVQMSLYITCSRSKARSGSGTTVTLMASGRSRRIPPAVRWNRPKYGTARSASCPSTVRSSARMTTTTRSSGSGAAAWTPRFGSCNNWVPS